jgi:TRAP-type uncharacterized transport system substrate-binding protein
VWNQTPDHRLSVIHTGRGMGDNLRALAAGEVDVAVITPGCFAKLAADGLGPFADRPMPELRGIASLPHRDAMLFAGHADLGIENLSDLQARKPAVRLSIGANDPDGFMGLGARILLGAAGVTLSHIEAWGGSIRYHEEPFGCLEDLEAGRADVIISEAIMTPNWVRLSQRVPLRFVGVNGQEAGRLREDWGLGTVTVPAGYLTGMTQDVTTLDYADWLIVTTTALPDEDAALLARSVTENAAPLEMQYRHLPAERSPLSYPITAEHAAATSVPLHAGAEAVYNAVLNQ